MYRSNVLEHLTKPTMKLIDVLRLLSQFKEYARELANKMDIDTKTSYRSGRFMEKNPLIRDVRMALDLVKEYYIVASPKKAIKRMALLTSWEQQSIAELVMKMIEADKLSNLVAVPSEPQVTVQDLFEDSEVIKGSETI